MKFIKNGKVDGTYTICLHRQLNRLTFGEELNKFHATDLIFVVLLKVVFNTFE